MSKKTVLIHSNFVRAFTGFGKNKKNIMRYLFDTGKYNLVELANGLHWSDPQTETVPWTCRGSLPTRLGTTHGFHLEFKVLVVTYII